MPVEVRMSAPDRDQLPLLAAADDPNPFGGGEESLSGGNDGVCLGGSHRTELASVREPETAREVKLLARAVATAGRASRKPTGRIRVLRCAKCGTEWRTAEVAVEACDE